jgi:hypothetical protein
MKLYLFFGEILCPSSGFIHCTLSNGICHTGLWTAFEQDQEGTHFYLDPARKLMMDRGTVRNMKSFIPK